MPFRACAVKTRSAAPLASHDVRSRLACRPWAISPGGEVGGLFDLVDGIRAIKQRSAKPLWAVASEAALSAAYAVASAADRIYVSRTGEVGSVGVVAVHLDESGADAVAGLKWTLIHAGASKTDGNPHEPLSPRATAGIQADVDHLYGQLAALVAANRGLSAEAVRATEAAIYRGEKAVTAGLADRIGTVAQAIADLETALEAKRIRAGPPADRTVRRQSLPLARTTAMNTSDPAIDEAGAAPPEDAAGKTEVTSDLLEAPPDTDAPDRPAPVPDAHAIADRLRAEFSEIATVAAQAARLGIDIDTADALRRGLKAEPPPPFGAGENINLRHKHRLPLALVQTPALAPLPRQATSSHRAEDGPRRMVTKGEKSCAVVRSPGPRRA